MPTKTTRPNQSTGTTGTQVTTPQKQADKTDQSMMGNNAVQERMASEQKKGGMYGKLEDKVMSLASSSSFVGYAHDIVDSASGSLESWLQGQIDPKDSDAAGAFVKAIEGEMHGMTDVIMVDGGIAEGLAEIAEQNKGALVVAALAGAVAHILSNPKLPTLKTDHDFGDGHSVYGSLSIGRVFDIALEEVKLGYRYKQNALNAKLDLSHNFQDDYTRFDGSLKYSSGDGISPYVRGMYDSKGAWDAAAGFGASKGDLPWGVEGYANENQNGLNAKGVRANLTWRF